MASPRVFNKHHRNAPADAVYVGRGSPWGNPFRIGPDGDRQAVIARFEAEALPRLDVRPLIGRDLVCFCAPLACHADVLLRAARTLANKDG